MEAIFFNQSSHLMSYSSEILEEDPLSTVNPPPRRSLRKNSSLLRQTLSSVRQKLSRQSELIHDRVPSLEVRSEESSLRSSLRASRKQRSSKNIKNHAGLEPSESSLPLNSDPIFEAESSSEHRGSSRSIRRCIVAVDPLKQKGVRQFSLKKTLLQRSKLKPVGEIAVETAKSGLASPEDSSERQQTFENKLTDQISHTPTMLNNTSLKQVESASQLPKIVALISVKKPVFKRKKIVKMILPKKALIDKTSPNQSTSKVDNKVRVSLQMTTKKQLSLKKVFKKASSINETSSLEPEVDKQKQTSSEGAAPKEDTKLEKLPKSTQALNSESSLSKVGKRKPTAKESNADEPVRTIPCSECDKLFVSDRSRARHFWYHKMSMSYACSDCPKIFMKRSSFLSHASTHRKSGWIACSLCPAKFAWPNTFRAHLMGHVGRLKDPLRCLRCDKKFWYQQSLERHVKRGQCRKKEPRQQATLQCDVCQKLLTTRGNLKKHLAMHQGLKPFVCKTCGFRFTAQSSLKEHARIHSGHRPFVCHVCGKSFAQSSGFRQHLAIHNRECKFVCKLCNKGFKLNRYLVKHMDTMHVDESKYNCHLCGKLFKLSDYLRRHIKAVHSVRNDTGSEREDSAEDWESDGTDGSPGMPAGELDDVTEPVNKAETEGELQEVVLHKDKENTGNVGLALGEPSREAELGTDEEAIEQMCNSFGAWSRDNQVKLAAGVLDNVDHGALEVCEGSVETERNGQQSDLNVDNYVVLDISNSKSKPSGSIEAVTLERNTGAAAAGSFKEQRGINDLPPVAERRSRVRPFRCSVCSKSFRKQKTLEAHMGSHSQDRPFECDVCRHRFNTKQEVRRHLQSHGINSADKLRCSLCGKMHLRLVDRERHVCGVERTYGCTKCGAKFEDRQQFHRHVAVAHKASLECSVCGKLSTTSWNLKKHMTVHTGDKPFVCEVCGARFTANQSLKVHAVCHAAQDRRPYVCSVCAKTFTQKSSLRQHEMLHDTEPRHQCSYCDKKFKVGSYLRRHIAVLHAVEKRFICDHCGKRYGLRSALLIHEQSHRERSRLQCPDCDKTFSDKRYLRKHTRKEHLCSRDTD